MLPGFRPHASLPPLLLSLPVRCLCLSVSLAPSVTRSTAAVSWKPWERLTGADRTASATPGDDASSAGVGAGAGALDAQPWKLYEGSPDTVRVAQGFRPSLVLCSCVRGRCPNKYWRCPVWLAPAQVLVKSSPAHRLHPTNGEVSRLMYSSLKVRPYQPSPQFLTALHAPGIFTHP